MAVLTDDEQALFDVAKAAMPHWYTGDERANEYMGAAAKIMGAAYLQAKHWLATQAFVKQAVGPTSDEPDWLGLHAKDRGTFRQDGETDAALRERLINLVDADEPRFITRTALVAAVQAVLDAYGVTADIDTAELPRDGLFWNYREWGEEGVFTGPDGDDLMRFIPDRPFRRPINGETYRASFIAPNTGSNAGDYTITQFIGETYINGDAVAEVDAGVVWKIKHQDGSTVASGSGGEFTTGFGNLARFVPDTDFPALPRGRLTITFTFAMSSGNEGTFRLRGPAGIEYLNASGAADVDTVVEWRIINVRTIIGTGGIFFGPTASVMRFRPDVTFPFPPFNGSGSGRIQTYKLTISGASSVGNDGTFTITGLQSNDAKYANGSGVAGTDSGVLWQVERINARDISSEGSPFGYLSRGCRIGRGRGACVVIMIGYISDADLRAAVVRTVREMLRQRKGAGVQAIIEARATAP